MIKTKNIVLLLSLLISINLLSSRALSNIIDPVIDFYKVEENEKSKLIPFGFYINEAGFMIGAFYYNIDIMEKGAKTSVGALWSPTSNTSTLWVDLYDISLNDRLSTYASTSIIKFNDVRIYWLGNDSPNYEAETMDIPTVGTIPTSKGYAIKEGWTQAYYGGLKYSLFDHTDLYTEYRYESSSSKEKDYITDTMTLGLESSFVDNKMNPHQGVKFITSVKKSLNMLGHDKDNDWDYYKIDADLMGFIPITERSTLALRAYTQFTDGKEVVDQERTLLMNYVFQEEGQYTEVAPYLDQALLGDFETFRGYYYYRFRDRHSFLMQSEYRFPIYGHRFQGMVFGELGRVAPDYDFSLFFEDMKYCWGGGFRFYFNQDMVIRADLGHSEEEDLQIRINFGQAF